MQMGRGGACSAPRSCVISNGLAFLTDASGSTPTIPCTESPVHRVPGSVLHDGGGGHLGGVPCGAVPVR